MKAVEQVTLMTNGSPIRDSAADVILTEYMQMATDKKPLPEDAYPILTTEYLIKRMIDLASYKSRTEQRKADTLYEKIKITQRDGKDVVVLEEGELAFLNKIRENFPPFLSGRIFEPFHKAMENPIDFSL